MTEVIELIERRLLEVRTRISGCRARIDSLEERKKAEEELIKDLLNRELFIVNALDKLKE